MIAKVDSACLMGMDAARVHVEVNLAKGLPYFSIVGLPDASVREAKDRVVAAIRNSGFEFPSRRVTVNLAPADLKKEGACFDLAIAVGVLLASEIITLSRWPSCIWLGELALDGSIRHVRGALPLARSLTQQGFKQLALPHGNAAEVSFIRGMRIYPVRHLKQVAQWLVGEAPSPLMPLEKSWEASTVITGVDLADIKAQAAGKRALEIAAAGGHHLLLSGCPGTGKSLLAQALPTIMPPWTLDEAVDASQVHSLSGYLGGSGLLRTRPYRAPHHTVSSAALIGGGDVPMPGEISLAHRGILFMDELPEFRRDALEALRQPLEEGVVRIRRVRGQATYPAECLLVAAMNPCPCGFRGHPKKECLCSTLKMQKYVGKISGPVMDRIDLQVEIPTLRVEELFSEGCVAETSAIVRIRVAQARQRQAQRYGMSGRINSELNGKSLQEHCALDEEGKHFLKALVDRLGLSARSFDRIRKVSRTIADLDGSPHILSKHLAEAVQFRAFDRTLI